MKRIFPGLLAICMLLICAGIARGQEYPSRPIRMLAPEAGGGADFLARLVAQGLSNGLRQQVIVENRAGSVVIAVDALMNAPADGYTILFYSNSLWVQPYLQEVRYDPLRDLAPITLAVSNPNVLAVHPSLPVRSVAELISLAKRKPGELNFAAGGFGSGNHLAAELFKYMAGVNMVYVPYKGAGPALSAALAGEVSIVVATTTTVAPFIKTGKLRALGVTSAQPSDLAPGLPTVAAAVPGYASTLTFGVFAPARTPVAVIERLNREIVRYVKSAETKEQFFKAGAEPVGNSPEELAAYMKADMALMSKVIKEAGIKVN